MATKKSVFLCSHTTDWINATTANPDKGEGPHWSESINATFEQMRYLLRGALPDLSQDEWQIILNTYAGSYFPAHGVPARIASDIMDSIGEVSLDNVETHYRALVEKVHAMSQLEQLATLYFVQIFWSEKRANNFDEIIESIKAKF